ncbi:hypothetical protein D1013_08795 [Euzebyella marina]|uniref:Uncharacterized protein n=1 Tax=Euzebyella marina TaxID=1761453 RepID=A0A3G2L5I7_9FLAO|nr:hypothetical protein D1013_08795 [Euzebyella marina]
MNNMGTFAVGMSAILFIYVIFLYISSIFILGKIDNQIDIEKVKADIVRILMYWNERIFKKRNTKKIS